MSETNSHPKGLYLLFLTELWERFSYYGMRAIFTLYMINALVLSKEEASGIYGSYTGLVYLTPLLGGYIADRYWGNRRSIFWGGMIMALGQFCMFFSAVYYNNTAFSDLFAGTGFLSVTPLPRLLMILGLTFLIMGNGLFKPNISTMVGDLYSKHDRRKDSAFTIFYMGINVGATIAPLWCGFLGDTGNPEDYKWGFLSAAIGMLFGVFMFELFKNKYLMTPEGEPIGIVANSLRKSEGLGDSAEKENGNKVPERSILQMFSWGAALVLIVGFFYWLQDYSDIIGAFIYSLCFVVPAFIITDSSLTKIERQRITVVYIIAFFVIFFWAAFEQAGVSLTYFAEEQMDRSLLGWEIPTSFFQSVNAVFVVALAPIIGMLWSLLGRKGIEPSSPMKQAAGLFCLSMGYLVISFGVSGIESDHKVSMMWLIGLYFLHTLGELSLSPIGLSLVNKLSPTRFASLMMGVWFMSTATANKFAGVLSALYPEELNGVVKVKHLFGYEISNLYDFFMVFVVMSGVASVLLFCLTKYLRKLMNGIE